MRTRVIAIGKAIPIYWVFLDSKSRPILDTPKSLSYQYEYFHQIILLPSTVIIEPMTKTFIRGLYTVLF